METKNPNRLLAFIKEAKGELHKVNWPTRQQTINYTAMVIGISIVVALFLGSLDVFFGYLLKTYIIK